MSERSGASTLAAMSLEEPGGEQASPRAAGPLRCGPCTVWPRQQTWLCAVPLVMGFVGLGLSLMLLKWIVVGSVQDYVPTDLVDAKGIGQDPIFMSQPSAVPKGPDAAAATTTAMAATTTVAVVSTTTLLAADGTAPAPRTRPPSNHSSANGGNNHAPHLHNRVGNRVPGTSTTTARTTRLTPPVGKDTTPRSTTARRNGHSVNVRPGPTSTTTTTTTTVAPTSSTTAKSTVKVSPPTSPPVPPAKPTRWNHGRSATRPHNRHRTLAPTSPSLRSEVFKPCIDDKDLAFCLNEGECSIIETVAGVHRHCRCKEGYHGLRCDQFVPKTDAILSDPTSDELGIEFMESRETYQRQVLSIFCIASGICLLGVACMVLYRRNKRRREKLRAHLSESRILRDCSINGPKLMSKSSPRPQCGLHKCCKSHGTSSPPGGSLACGPAVTTPPILNRALSKGKRFRSSSLCLSPAQRHRETHHFSTPPIPRGKQNLIGGARVAGHAYRHLQEVEATEMEAESSRGLVSHRERSPGQMGSNTRTQPPLSDLAAGRGWNEVPCTRLDGGAATPPPPPSSPPRPAPLWARSIPIIPSLQGCDNEGGSDNTGRRNQGVCSVPARHDDAASSSSSVTPAAPPSESAAAPGFPARHASPAGGDCTAGAGSGPASARAEAPDTVAEPEGASSKHERLVILATAPNSQHGVNTITAVTVLESEGKSVRYTPRVLYSCPGVRGSKPGETGECQRHPVDRGTNYDTAALGSCRGSGIACAKPSAS